MSPKRELRGERTENVILAIRFIMVGHVSTDLSSLSGYKRAAAAAPDSNGGSWELETEGREMEKRLAQGGGRGGGGEKVEWRWWAGMSSEVLALIFGRMTADELSRTVPFVCRGWREVLAGPYCWAEIDVEQWCRRVNRLDVIESAVRRLIRRSRGNLRRLSAYRIGNSAFSYVANSYNFRTFDLPFICCFSLSCELVFGMRRIFNIFLVIS